MIMANKFFVICQQGESVWVVLCVCCGPELHGSYWVTLDVSSGQVSTASAAPRRAKNRTVGLVGSLTLSFFHHF